jgi:hypothetical protein
MWTCRAGHKGLRRFRPGNPAARRCNRQGCTPSDNPGGETDPRSQFAGWTAGRPTRRRQRGSNCRSEFPAKPSHGISYRATIALGPAGYRFRHSHPATSPPVIPDPGKRGLPACLWRSPSPPRSSLQPNEYLPGRTLFRIMAAWSRGIRVGTCLLAGLRRCTHLALLTGRRVQQRSLSSSSVQLILQSRRS